MKKETAPLELRCGSSEKKKGERKANKKKKKHGKKNFTLVKMQVCSGVHSYSHRERYQLRCAVLCQSSPIVTAIKSKAIAKKAHSTKPVRLGGNHQSPANTRKFAPGELKCYNCDSFISAFTRYPIKTTIS